MCLHAYVSYKSELVFKGNCLACWGVHLISSLSESNISLFAGFASCFASSVYDKISRSAAGSSVIVNAHTRVHQFSHQNLGKTTNYHILSNNCHLEILRVKELSSHLVLKHNLATICCTSQPSDGEHQEASLSLAFWLYCTALSHSLYLENQIV